MNAINEKTYDKARKSLEAAQYVKAHDIARRAINVADAQLDEAGKRGLSGDQAAFLREAVAAAINYARANA